MFGWGGFRLCPGTAAAFQHFMTTDVFGGGHMQNSINNAFRRVGFVPEEAGDPDALHNNMWKRAWSGKVRFSSRFQWGNAARALPVLPMGL